ncbi:hypothetical protein SAMN05428988_2683 [Chitinophaga sp. YR573]|nr:hypothetical protein SAMN05428988_2683 [Chitinophaga sp. YR573]
MKNRNTLAFWGQIQTLFVAAYTFHGFNNELMNDETFLLEKDLTSKHFFWLLSKKTYFCLAFIK